MSVAKTISRLAFGLTLLAVSAVAYADSVDITQVPAGDKWSGHDREKAIDPDEETSGNGDYQSEVLSNPIISPPARANALMGGAGGNTAIVIQQGSSNTSSVVQKGDNNYADQTQNGADNDLRVEQYGKNNSSTEQQTGKHNHKVKIQNGKTSDDLLIEQAVPASNDKQQR